MRIVTGVTVLRLMGRDILLRCRAAHAVTAVTGEAADQAGSVAAGPVEVTGSHGTVTGFAGFSRSRIIGDAVAAARLIVADRQGGRFVRSTLKIDRRHHRTGVAGLTVDGRGIVPDRLTIGMSSRRIAISGTVAGVTDRILVVGHIADRTVDMINATAIVGMADRTGQGLTAGGVDVAVMAGAQRCTAAGSNAGNTVLMTGTAGAGGSEIPVRGRSAVTDDRAGTARLGVISAGRDAGEDDFIQAVNVSRPGGSAGQSRVARRRGAVADITGITGIQMLDMADRVILLCQGHTCGIVTVAGVTGGDGINAIRPGRGDNFKGIGRVTGPLAAVGVTGNVITGAGAGGGVGRGQSEVRGLDGKLERTGRSKDALEGPLVMSIDEVVVMTEYAGEVVTAGDTGVGGMGGGRFVLVDSGGRIVDCAIDRITGWATCGSS